MKAGILFGMKENLMIQIVYPDYLLPREYTEVIESIDNHKIISSLNKDYALHEEAAVVVLHDWTWLSQYQFRENQSYVLLTTKEDFFDRYLFLKNALPNVARISIVFTDIESFTNADFKKYDQVLNHLSTEIEKMYVDGRSPQLNIVTDRMMLGQMNNCGAGVSNITLAPNGKFYVCPAFYYDDEKDNVGSLGLGLGIKNEHLYKLEYAPICRHCDAYQCKRCVWLNRKTTLEVNTPSHEQCVVAHIERNASRELLQSIRKHGIFLPEQGEIKEIEYLDPFDNHNDW